MAKRTGRIRPHRQDAESHDASLMAGAIERWFAQAARDLPWRDGLPGSRDPYRALVAEAMLQQTQVSRVVEKFGPFLKRFPTVQSLAHAGEADVLAMWSGLGYYRRARNLHAAAKAVVQQFGGEFPRSPAELQSLPGVGRYTSGAIASIALGIAAPIVDGNVARVLLRIHGRAAASDDRSVQDWLWTEAQQLVTAATSPGALNEGLMELGATVCLPAPATPRCTACPVQSQCTAHARKQELEIPLPKSRTVRKDMLCRVARVVRADGALLVEQRPEKGMWGGLWQAVTLEGKSALPTAAALAKAIGISSRELGPADTQEFLATHRRVELHVHQVRVAQTFVPRRGEFVMPEEISCRGLGNLQRRVVLGILA